ncbi:MAG: ATP-binding protein [Cellulomonas sp.]
MTVTDRVVPTSPGAEELLRDAVVAELGVLRAIVRGDDPTSARAEASAAAIRLGDPSPLDRMTLDLGLSEFERATLLLAAGPELVAAAGTELEARTGSPLLTFGAALALLPAAHWSALGPGAPLRSWELVTLADPRSPSHSALLVDERVLHHLVGAGTLDARLEHLANAVPLPAPVPWLVGPLQAAARDLAVRWSLGTVVIEGTQPDNNRAVAVAAAHASGRALHEIAAADLPTDPADLARVIRLVERESRLDPCAWLVMLDDAPPDVAARVARACAGVGGHLALCVRERAELGGGIGSGGSGGRGGGGHGGRGHSGGVRGRAVVHVPRLDLPGRTELLTRALHDVGASTADVPVVAGVFDLSVAQAHDAAIDVAHGTGLWQASRARSQVDPGGVAERVAPRASWADLVLPPMQIAQLDALVSAVRHRSLVLDTWGFAEKSARGLGTTALFAGASGTGKTLAAEVVAHELELDLLHVDLSQVVSKYIGETEKNLGVVFDAAEQGSAVLLFDEADTIFGKRSEVKDSHDRYANLEVGYLLQRMERFRGLAILTTNARGSLDQAFLRRLHTVVAFPYPDVAARVRLWRTAFPPGTPTADVDLASLAQVDVPGGAIAAAALTAAYLAAGQGGPVTTAHVREALTWELAKSGRTVAAR